MNEHLKLIKKIALSSSSRERGLVALAVLILLSIGFYWVALFPHLNYNRSIRLQLSGEKVALLSGLQTSEVIGVLTKRLSDEEKKLKALNRAFFIEAEAGKFLSELAEVVRADGNQVVSLKPLPETPALSRVEEIKKELYHFHFSDQQQMLALLEKNQPAINSGGGSELLLKQFLENLPEEERFRFITLWGSFSRMALSNIKLGEKYFEVSIQGRFQGIISLLAWLKRNPKIIDLSEIQVGVVPEKAPEINATLTFRIFVI